MNERWDRFWFDGVPPHIYALLRITLGLVGFLVLGFSQGTFDMQELAEADIASAAISLNAVFFLILAAFAIKLPAISRLSPEIWMPPGPAVMSACKLWPIRDATRTPPLHQMSPSSSMRLVIVIESVANSVSAPSVGSGAGSVVALNVGRLRNAFTGVVAPLRPVAGRRMMASAAGPATVRTQINAGPDGPVFSATHDGYLDRYGVLHRRTLSLKDSGRRLALLAGGRRGRGSRLLARLLQLLARQLMVRDRVNSANAGADIAVGDAFDLQRMKHAEIGDLVEGEPGVLDQPDSGCDRHQRLFGHESSPKFL